MEDIPLAIWAYDQTATYNNVDGTYDGLVWIQPGEKPSEATLTTSYETYINTNDYKKTKWLEPLQRESQLCLQNVLDGPNTYIVVTVLWRLQNSQSVPQRYLDYASIYAAKVVSYQLILDTAQDELQAMTNVTTVSDYQAWYDNYLAQIKAVT